MFFKKVPVGNKTPVADKLIRLYGIKADLAEALRIDEAKLTKAGYSRSFIAVSLAQEVGKYRYFPRITEGIETALLVARSIQ